MWHMQCCDGLLRKNNGLKSLRFWVHMVYPEAYTAQKMKFSITDFFSKCDQSFLRIWSHLLKKSVLENFIFCAVLCLCRSHTNIKMESFATIVNGLLLQSLHLGCFRESQIRFYIKIFHQVTLMVYTLLCIEKETSLHKK